MNFLAELKEQRWDDHRYYHHSRINQSLHLISALSFLSSYALLMFNPMLAVMVGWLIAMLTRQAGHFFFEPKGYDTVNHASHEYKESIKVGYNLKRKIVLLSVWIAAPVVLYINPTFWGLFTAYTNVHEFLYNLSLVWIIVAVGGLLFRTVQLFFIKSVQSGLVWLTKIMTDPFHDVMIYYKSPYYLLKGELIDPMTHCHS